MGKEKTQVREREEREREREQMRVTGFSFSLSFFIDAAMNPDDLQFSNGISPRHLLASLIMRLLLGFRLDSIPLAVVFL